VNNRATGQREGGVIGMNAGQIEARTKELAELLSGDPDQLRNYLRRSTRDKRSDSLVLKALREGQEPEPILPEIDNHAIQFTVLRDFILSADFADLEEDRQQALLQRGTQHRQIMQQQQQQVMQAAQAAKGTGDQVSDAVAQSGALGGSPATTQQVGA
jgi:ParB-like chromosome segregation protein Spo0J